MLLLLLVVGCLCAPALWTGLNFDDYWFRAAIREHYRAPWGPRGPFDLFRLWDPVGHQTALDAGALPWFSAPTLKVASCRPLASADFALGARWFGEHPWVGHAESILLYLAVVALVYRLNRKLFGMTAVGGLATLFFGLDDQHAFTVQFLANRNALWSCAFGLIAILVYCRAGLRAIDRWLSASAFALALLFGESALAVVAYVFSYEIWIERRSVADKAKALLPHFLVALVWALLYRTLGFGSEGGAEYLNPTSQPLLWLSKFPSRFVGLFLSQFTLPIADLWSLAAGRSSAVVVAGIAIVAGGSYYAYRIIGADRQVGFLISAFGLSLIPMTFTIPSDRNLLFASVAGFGLIALLLKGCVEQSRYFVASGLLIVHLLIASVSLPFRVFFGMGDSHLVQNAKFIDEELRSRPPAVPGPVFINASGVDSVYGWAVRAHLGLEPQATRVLNQGFFGSIRFRRTSSTSLRVTRMDRWGRNEAFRAADFRVGESFRFSDVTAVIVETREGKPYVVDYEFGRPLEDFAWFAWGQKKGALPPDGQYRRLVPPDVGREVVWEISRAELADL